jgi:hypothetical protein
VLEWIDDLIERRCLTVKGSFPHVYITHKGRALLAESSGSAPRGAAIDPTAETRQAKLLEPVLANARYNSQRTPLVAKTPPAIESEDPAQPKWFGLRLKIEMWKQGGPAPEPKEILHGLENSDGATSGDLIVFLGTLAEVGHRPALRVVQKILREGSDPQLVAAACRAAGKLGAPAAAADLLKLLDNKSPLIRAASAHALGCLRIASALPRLENLAATDTSAAAKLAAAAACILIKNNKQAGN